MPLASGITTRSTSQGAEGEQLNQPLMSASSDPFYVAKEEIESGLRSVQQLFNKFREETRNPAASSASSSGKLGNEILSEIKQLQYDLQDVETTIGIVEANPGKFRVDQRELQGRKQFLQQTERSLKELTSSVQGEIRRIASSGGGAGSSSASSSSRGPQSVGNTRHQRPGGGRELDDFVAQGTQNQRQLVKEQDEQLAELSKCTERLNQTAQVINTELKEQERMLTELDEDIDRETEKMSFVMRRLGILMQSSDRSQLWTILILFCIFMFLLMLVIG
mmetsp:Transcript_10675/g.26142  ORF Transcript_10675/g.26142 Transcript_10675/m.26142 type:complete len:278 (-) Transcript_10675:238-1071(-)